MSDKLAIVFDGPPANESGRFVEVELNGASVSFGEWQENGDYWELVLPEPHVRLAQLEQQVERLERALYEAIEVGGAPESTWVDTDDETRRAWPISDAEALAQQEDN